MADASPNVPQDTTELHCKLGNVCHAILNAITVRQLLPIVFLALGDTIFLMVIVYLIAQMGTTS